MAAVILALTMLFYVYVEVHRKVFFERHIYQIEQGSSLRDFAKELKKRGVMSHDWPFLVWSIIKRQSRSIKAGEYLLDQNSNLADVLDQIVSGQVVTYSVTLIEGWTFHDIRSALEAAEHLMPDSVGLTDREILTAIKSDYTHTEGLFFPDTYYSVRGDSQLSIFNRAYKLMEAKLAESWAARDPRLPFSSPYEALILASIIEKETGIVDERSRISGVLINRLRVNMPLQVDPTVIYGLGRTFDGDLRGVHLEADGPYNTYRRKGLPPTPISNPGLSSLQAAVRPLDTKDMFFVARGDGRHQFSETLEEHHRAVQLYLLRR